MTISTVSYVKSTRTPFFEVESDQKLSSASISAWKDFILSKEKTAEYFTSSWIEDLLDERLPHKLVTVFTEKREPIKARIVRTYDYRYDELLTIKYKMIDNIEKTIFGYINLEIKPDCIYVTGLHNHTCEREAKIGHVGLELMKVAVEESLFAGRKGCVKLQSEATPANFYWNLGFKPVSESVVRNPDPTIRKSLDKPKPDELCQRVTRTQLFELLCNGKPLPEDHDFLGEPCDGDLHVEMVFTPAKKAPKEED